MALDNPILCKHLSFTTDGLLSFIFNYKFVKNPNFDKGLVCRCVQVAVHQPAPPPFERENTKLPDVISDYHFSSLLH